MGEPIFYVAACWSKGSKDDTTNQTEKQQTLLLPEGEMSLANGLKLMENNGWKLIHIQANNAEGYRYYSPQPDRFYLFKKKPERSET